MDYSMPGFSVFPYLLDSPQIHVYWVSDAIYVILCCPLLHLPSIFPSIRVFSNEPALCIRWPKGWSFSFSISIIPSNSLKASILCHSALFTVQLSHPYMTTRKTIALIIWTFVSKMMSLTFNMLSRYLIAFLPREAGYRKLGAGYARHSVM